MSNSSNYPAVPNGNYHIAKRNLLRQGVEEGKLRMSVIRDTLPPPHVSLAELELFLFSLSALGVSVVHDLK